MVLDKYSLDGKTYPHFNFETLYIKFQEDFLRFAFFQILPLNCGLFLKISYMLLQKIDKLFKKKGFYVIKRRKSFKFQIGGLTYQIKIDIYDN